jgi:hypothetical protein
MQIERSDVQAEPEESTARDVSVSLLAARQHGIASYRELIGCGLTNDAVSVRSDNGRLHPLHHGVYAVGHGNPTRDGWLLAAIRACGEGSALCRATAAGQLEIADWEDRNPDVLVRGENPPRHRDINGHRTNYLPPEHITWVRGIPVTTAERTLLDLAGVWPERKLRRAVRQAQFRKLTTLRSLIAALHGPGPQRGRKKLARIVATGAAPTQSELEDVVLDLMLRGGIEHPLVNAPLDLASRRIVPDFRWPANGVVVEADGSHHDDPFERAADRERQQILEARGDCVVRVTWKQAITRPAETLRRITEAGAPRRLDCSG